MDQDVFFSHDKGYQKGIFHLTKHVKVPGIFNIKIPYFLPCILEINDETIMLIVAWRWKKRRTNLIGS